MGLRGLGQDSEALGLIERAIVHCRKTGDRFMEPECLRLKGELLLEGEKPDRAAAEAALLQSLELSREHKAKSWELRAATSLAKLWQSSGKEVEARDLLAPIYDCFTEGFDTRDLSQANILLQELRY